jgi:hypothetical protein
MTTFRYAANIIISTGTGGDKAIALDLDDYTQETQAALEEIVTTSFTGWGLIMNIRGYSDKRVIITPQPRSVRNAGVRSQPEWNGTNEVQVYYNPGAWQAVGSALPGTSKDEALMHELLHAYRMMKGPMSMDKCDRAPYFYDTFEDFFAILLTNIYRSAKRRKGLRKDHHGYDELNPELSTSRSFLMLIGSHISWVRRVATEEFMYCTDVIRKDGPFNPIDYFLAHSDECLARLKYLNSDEFRSDPFRDPEFEKDVEKTLEDARRLTPATPKPDATKPGSGKPER